MVRPVVKVAVGVGCAMALGVGGFVWIATRHDIDHLTAPTASPGREVCLSSDLPLVREAGIGDVDGVRNLMDGHHDLSEADENENTAPDCAIPSGHSDALALLLDHGADPDRPSLDRYRPLELAVLDGNVDGARLLQGRGAATAGLLDAVRLRAPSCATC